MADYLRPINKISLENRRPIFQIPCEINPLPANKGNPGPCLLNECKQMLNDRISLFEMSSKWGNYFGHFPAFFELGTVFWAISGYSKEKKT